MRRSGLVIFALVMIAGCAGGALNRVAREQATLAGAVDRKVTISGSSLCLLISDVRYVMLVECDELTRGERDLGRTVTLRGYWRPSSRAEAALMESLRQASRRDSPALNVVPDPDSPLFHEGDLTLVAGSQFRADAVFVASEVIRDRQ
jgi:hypothetical protein